MIVRTGKERRERLAERENKGILYFSLCLILNSSIACYDGTTKD
jgi:hypothetical protein